MSKTFLIAFLVGVGVVIIAVTGVFLGQRSSRVRLDGRILKVRTAPLDENNSVAVLDFRFTNPSNTPFWVRTVTVLMEENNGQQYQGATVSETDAKRLFQAVPLLGQKFNDTLLMNDKIQPHASQDRMVAASFQAPESRLEGRKRFIIRIEDVDGPVTEIAENRQ